MKKVFCDKCGKEIKIEPSIITCKIIDYTELSFYEDLCQECLEEYKKRGII